MRILWKILLTLVFVGVVPVAVSGLSSVLLARDAITETEREKLASEARHLAEIGETTILEAVEGLAQRSELGLGSLSGQDLAAALWLIYRDDARMSAVALLDAKTGETVTELVYQETVSEEPGLRGHPPFPQSAQEAFAAHIPLDEAAAVGRAVSLPYADQGRGLPLIALAVRVQGRDERGAPTAWVVAAEVSLEALNQRFEETRDEGMRAFFVDLKGDVVCATNKARALKRPNALAHPAVKQIMNFDAPASGTLTTTTTDGMLAAWARAPRLAAADGKSWGVVVERKESDVLAKVSVVEQRSAFWTLTALVIAILSGLILARGLARPLEVLSRAALAFGKGEHAARAAVTSKDETGRLANAFNQMADAIEERDKELRSFNEELQERVDERTSELKETRDQLVTSQKMAAVGELGAGVAHEINNPLASVLGSAQLALLRADKNDERIRPHLVDIEKEALRIREIVESLLKLSSDESQQATSALDLNQVIDSALALCARPLIARRIVVRKDLDKDAPKIRGKSADLQTLVMQLVQNAQEAMDEGGTLSVKTETVDGGNVVRLTIGDTGAGIAEPNQAKIFEPFFTTRTGAGKKGMGLAIVHRIVEDHQARIHVESRLGKGTQMRVTFPASREQLHLS